MKENIKAIKDKLKKVKEKKLYKKEIAAYKKRFDKCEISCSELSQIEARLDDLKNICDGELYNDIGEINSLIETAKNNISQIDGFDIKNILNLMEIYLSEWCHRDEFLWLQVFRYFYVTILVIFLPYIADYLKIDLPPFIDITFFPVAGIILSLVFLYLSLGYTKRLEAVSKTYQTVINCLPVFLQRKKVSELKHGKIFNHRLAGCLCFVIFVFTLLLSIFMLINLIRTTKTDLNFYLQPLKQIIN